MTRFLYTANILDATRSEPAKKQNIVLSGKTASKPTWQSINARVKNLNIPKDLKDLDYKKNILEQIKNKQKSAEGLSKKEEDKIIKEMNEIVGQIEDYINDSSKSSGEINKLIKKIDSSKVLMRTSNEAGNLFDHQRLANSEWSDAALTGDKSRLRKIAEQDSLLSDSQKSEIFRALNRNDVKAATEIFFDKKSEKYKLLHDQGKITDEQFNILAKNVEQCVTRLIEKGVLDEKFLAQIKGKLGLPVAKDETKTDPSKLDQYLRGKLGIVVNEATKEVLDRVREMLKDGKTGEAVRQLLAEAHKELSKLQNMIDKLLETSKIFNNKVLQNFAKYIQESLRSLKDMAANIQRVQQELDKIATLKKTDQTQIKLIAKTVKELIKKLDEAMSVIENNVFIAKIPGLLMPQLASFSKQLTNLTAQLENYLFKENPLETKDQGELGKIYRSVQEQFSRIGDRLGQSNVNNANRTAAQDRMEKFAKAMDIIENILGFGKRLNESSKDISNKLTLLDYINKNMDVLIDTLKTVASKEYIENIKKVAQEYKKEALKLLDKLLENSDKDSAGTIAGLYGVVLDAMPDKERLAVLERISKAAVQDLKDKLTKLFKQVSSGEVVSIDDVRKLLALAGKRVDIVNELISQFPELKDKLSELKAVEEAMTNLKTLFSKGQITPKDIKTLKTQIEEAPISDALKQTMLSLLEQESDKLTNKVTQKSDAGGMNNA